MRGLGAKLRAPGSARRLDDAAGRGVRLRTDVAGAHDHGAAHHYIDGEAILTVALIAAPLMFLVGIGGFDSGSTGLRPTDAPRQQYTWRYFRIDTDQGDRHPIHVTSFFFLLVGGLVAMLIGIELAQPGAAVRRREHLQRPSQRARLDPDLLLHHPRVRGLRQLRDPDHDRSARHGVPALERPLLLAAAGGRADHALELPGARRSVADGWTAYTPLSTDRGRAVLVSLGVQFAGASCRS